MLALATSASAQTFNVVADTFTSGSSQSSNYGDGVKVNIENGGSGLEKTRVGFFRYDLSSYSGGTISGATFTMFSVSQFGSSQNFDVYGISEGGTSEGFSEGTGATDGTEFDWSSSGYGYSSGQDITDSANFADLVSVGSITGMGANSSGSLSSSALDAFLNNDVNNIVSFVVVNTNGDGDFNGFAGKESSSSSGSTLTIVPEPASAALALGLGIFAAVSLVRRRRS
ncbi:MAG: hypothetical protein CML13_05875 [Puniceicoccaceae bacterium]|nr:hypothetical protein [Puniceicoccaceae bacterium]